AGLAQLDRDLERLVTGFLDARRVAYERREEAGRVILEVPPSALLPSGLQAGLRVAIGPSRGLGDADPLHLGHPLVAAAVAEAREATAGPLRALLRPGARRLGGALASRPRARGRLVVTKVRRR